MRGPRIKGLRSHVSGLWGLGPRMEGPGGAVTLNRRRRDVKPQAWGLGLLL